MSINKSQHFKKNTGCAARVLERVTNNAAADILVRFSHRLGESIRKPLWTHGVASKVLRPHFNRAQKTTPGVQMKKPICTTASAMAFLIGDEKCGLEVGGEE
ncbi:MAG: hypothetical protein A2Z83_00340 [Omnitrophica bacterium GWA2_52_8]|nr:MAG: hypothetical protein A2Z83_00340 [Omnitrophica bacterium GWA2_52_8]